MRDTRACRACLNTEGKLETIPDSWYRLFASLTGLQVSKSDGYPNYFCVECKSHMNKAIAFRKKSRRAFFVLKEIMLVKKEVNLSDILTLDRSTANLKSGLGICKPERVVYFELESLLDDQAPQNWNAVDSNVAIDVKGSVQTPGEAFPYNGPKQAAQVKLMDDDFNDSQEDGAQELTLEESREPDSDIDMEDIFKGLQAPESEKSDDEADWVPEVKVEKKKKRGHRQLSTMVLKDGNAKKAGVALANFEITKLTPEQQKEGFKLRLEKPGFKKAAYSCRVCVEAFTEWRFLKDHYNLHMRKNDCDVLCEICEDKCSNKDYLTVHISENHLYKYTCKICSEDLYALKDVFRHKTLHKFPQPPSATVVELMDKFHFIPVPEENMKENFKRLSKSAPFSCDHCATGFSKKTLLSYHLTKHRVPTSGKRGVCSICNICYYTEEFLKRHMESYHNYTYQCKLCSYEAQNRNLADYHMTCEHSEKCICEHCGANLRNRKTLYYHMKSRHATLSHVCVVCGRAFRRSSLLYCHQFKEHTILHLAEPPTGDGTNACKHCNVQFLSEKAYSNHLLQAGHEEAKDLPWKCLACKTLFDSEEESKDHTTRCQLIRFPSPCSLCGLMVNSHREYFKHCKASHPNYTSIVGHKRKLCDSCGKTYFYKCSCLNPSVDKPRIPRTSGNKYKCASCEIGYNKPEEIIYHVLYAHMEKPFICTICSKTFRRRGQCKDHILKVHAPVRPYGCPICDRLFSHIDFLRAHAKKNHEVKLALENTTEKHKRKFYLYPNMKVDLSLVDTRIVKSAKIFVADYTNQLFEDIDNYSDYIITNEDVKQKSGEIKKEEEEEEEEEEKEE